jgi:hypothetical protein
MKEFILKTDQPIYKATMQFDNTRLSLPLDTLRKLDFWVSILH